jgi:hypothetical protein
MGVIGKIGVTGGRFVLPYINGVYPSLYINYPDDRFYINGSPTTQDYIFDVIENSTGGGTWSKHGVFSVSTPNVTRYDYAGNLIKEEAAENLSADSTLFTSGTGAIVGSRSILAPDLTNQARLAYADAGSGYHFFSHRSASFVSGEIYALSCFLEPVNGTEFVQVTGSTSIFGSGQYANLNITGNGSVTAKSGVLDATIEYVGGYYRVSILVEATSSGTASSILLSFIDSGNSLRLPQFTSDGEAVNVWGGQVEIERLTSHYPTDGGTSTRAKDVIKSTDISEWVTQGVGTFIIEYEGNIDETEQALFAVSDGTFDERLLFRRTGGEIKQAIVTGGVLQMNSTIGTENVNMMNRAAFIYEADNSNLALNGFVGFDDVINTIPTVDQIILGADQNGTTNQNYVLKIKSIAYYPTRITNYSAVENTAYSINFITDGDSYTEGSGGAGIGYSLTDDGYVILNSAIGGSTLEQGVQRVEVNKYNDVYTLIFCDGSTNGHGTIEEDMAKYARIIDATKGNCIIISPSLFTNVVSSSSGQYAIDLTNSLLSEYSGKVVNAIDVARDLSGASFVDVNDAYDAGYSDASYTDLFYDGTHPNNSLADALTQAALDLL